MSMADDIADCEWPDDEPGSITDILQPAELNLLFPNQIQRDIFIKLINNILNEG